MSIDTSIPGVTRDSAWCYNAGPGLAGLHVEDGYLSFLHASIHLTLDTSVLPPSLDRDVMDLVVKLCGSKVWVFAPSR
jgi:hypothetical protein